MFDLCQESPRARICVRVALLQFEVDVADLVLEEKRHVFISCLVHRLRRIKIETDTNGYGSKH